MSLFKQLLALRGEMAQIAQEVYDQWDQSEEGFGGKCDQMSEELSGLIAISLEGVEIEEGGQDGDDHSFLIVSLGEESVLVDLPARVYERGSGYRWEKVEGIRFRKEDFNITPFERIVE